MAFSNDRARGSRVPGVWLWSFILLALNAALAWGPWTVWRKLWLFPLGLALQIFFVFFFFRRAPFQPKEAPLPLNPAGPAWFLGLGALALGLRLYGLVSVPVWPTWDDANYSYFAIGLSEKGGWPLFIGHEKTMPLFTWLQGGFFRLFPPSLFSMWLYPALLSLLAVPLGWWTARRFLPPSLSGFFAALLALGFWPLYYGRFDAYLGALQWVVEFLLLLLLGFFLHAPPKRAPWIALALGLGVGFSFYASMMFVIPAALLTAGVFLFCRNKPGLGAGTFLAYLLPAVVVSAPMHAGFLQNLADGHVFTYSLFSRQAIPWDRRYATLLSYFTSIFWGPADSSYWSFAPLWGGFLNPLGDALFFIGLATWDRFLGPLFRTWWWAALGLLLLPVLFFNTLECFRIDLVMPLCLVPVAAGLAALLVELAPVARRDILVLALAFSLGMDGYHLFGVFHQWSVNIIPGIQIKSPERYQAFQLLEETEKNQGPGQVFTDFVSNAYDQSLLTATYPFNAGRNPRLSPASARWAAILADLHYAPILQKRFPGTRIDVLSDAGASGSILCLALVPVDSPGVAETFLEWMQVHQALQDLYGAMPYVVENPDFNPVLGKLWSIYSGCGADPLLRAWVLEKGLDILLVGSDMTPALWLLEKPVEATRSYPFLDKKFAGVYFRLGIALLKSGDKGRAGECFIRASKFDPAFDLKKWMALAR